MYNFATKVLQISHSRKFLGLFFANMNKKV